MHINAVLDVRLSLKTVMSLMTGWVELKHEGEESMI
jgi:hypothetical protein